MFKSEFFISFKTGAHLQTVSNQHAHFQKKIMNPFFQNMRGQNHVHGRTGGQTDRQTYTPTFVCGGGGGEKKKNMFLFLGKNFGGFFKKTKIKACFFFWVYLYLELIGGATF